MALLTLKESSMARKDADKAEDFEPTALGRNIKRYREALGLSIRQLDRLSGVSNVAIGKYESGKTMYPSRRQIEAVAKALGRTVEELYADPDNPLEAPSSVPEFQYSVFLGQLMALLDDMDPERVSKVAEMFTQLDKKWVDHVLNSTEFAFFKQLQERKEEEGGKPGPKPYMMRGRDSDD